MEIYPINSSEKRNWFCISLPISEEGNRKKKHSTSLPRRRDNWKFTDNKETKYMEIHDGLRPEEAHYFIKISLNHYLLLTFQFVVSDFF